MVVAFRRHTLLPMDERHHAQQAAIPYAFAQLHPLASVKAAGGFLAALVEGAPQDPRRADRRQHPV